MGNFIEVKAHSARDAIVEQEASENANQTKAERLRKRRPEDDHNSICREADRVQQHGRGKPDERLRLRS